MSNRHLIILAMLLAAPVATWGQDYVPGEVLVKMKGRPSGSKSAAFMGQLSGKLALKSTFGRLNMHHMSLKPGQDVHAIIEELRSNPDVEYAEPNYILHKFDEGEGQLSEPRIFSSAEELSSILSTPPGVYGQSNANTQVTETWSAMHSGSDDVVVAVIDTGVDYAHSAFTESNAIWRNAGEIPGNGIDDDGNGYIDDVRGWNFLGNNSNPMDDGVHGTHVAGIVVGVGQDIIHGPRVLSKIKIMPLKFLSANGTGATSNAISAIYYAVNNHAQVINNSWGGANYSQALHDALAYAYNQGVVVVSAAGNSRSNNDRVPMYPANYPVPSAISVAATNNWDQLASFSNYGASTVHMGAPGVGIYSTIPGNGYAEMDGTSMAAPFVAGLAALAIREAPHLSGYQIRNLVINASTPVVGLVPRTIAGSRAHSLNTVVNAKTQTGVAAQQPGYVAEAPAGYRSPDSAKAKAGCGLVSTAVMRQSFGGNGGGGNGANPSAGTLGVILALTLMPVLAWQVLRVRASALASDPKNRRQHERFVMNSEIKVKVGDRELVGQMNTISMGGASFKADALLERGGIVTLQIASPDGNDQVQVEGRIVWNEQNQAYGVQFGENKESVLDSIKDWTKGLAKAS